MVVNAPIPKPDIWQKERFERKCVVQAEYYDALVSWVDQQEMSFRPAFPPRIVQSLYFDSCSLEDFGDTLSGVSERKKIRLRWYGAGCGVSEAVLEIKCKRNQRGIKLAYPISLPGPLSTIDLDRLVVLILQQLPEDAMASVEHANQAVALVQYKREYFVSWDERIRITLDRSVLIYDQFEHVRINDAMLSPLPEFAVLELKYDAKFDHEMKAWLQPFPRRVSRFSKYAIGVQRLLGV